jgi:hypothetical protein
LTSEREGKRAVWDLTICAAVLVYLFVVYHSPVLFLNLDSPVFGLLLIVFASYQLLEPHCRRRAR